MSIVHRAYSSRVRGFVTEQSPLLSRFLASLIIFIRLGWIDQISGVRKLSLILHNTNPLSALPLATQTNIGGVPHIHAFFLPQSSLLPIETLATRLVPSNQL